MFEKEVPFDRDYDVGSGRLNIQGRATVAIDAWGDVDTVDYEVDSARFELEGFWYPFEFDGATWTPRDPRVGDLLARVKNDTSLAARVEADAREDDDAPVGRSDYEEHHTHWGAR
jgi:hypothetical protein